ncbi:MAG: hypothetical protein QOI78_2112 [Actinomycetota bacterium]|nr:hypothetical protein [Actinomycetota bacterium]
MYLLEAHGQAIRAFGDAVHAAGTGDWDHRTPGAKWTVRDLVNHLVARSSGRLRCSPAPPSTTACSNTLCTMTVDAAVRSWDPATALSLPSPVTEPPAERLIDVVRPWVDDWQGLGLFDPPVAVGRGPGPRPASSPCSGAGRTETPGITRRGERADTPISRRPAYRTR